MSIAFWIVIVWAASWLFVLGYWYGRAMEREIGDQRVRHIGWMLGEANKRNAD